MLKKDISNLEKYIKNFTNQLELTNKSKHTVDSYKNTLFSFISYINEKYTDNNEFILENLKKVDILEFFEYKNNLLEKQADISPNTKNSYIHI